MDKEAIRTCLKCDKKFQSQSPGHRYCDTCRNAIGKYAGNYNASEPAARNGRVVKKDVSNDKDY